MGVYLNLETMAGGTPEEALKSALGVAAKTGVWVKMNLNGVDVLIHPEDRVAHLAENWRKAMDRGVDFCSSNIVPAK